MNFFHTRAPPQRNGATRNIQMSKTRGYKDDNDDTRILKKGERYVVPMYMCDSPQKSVAEHARNLRDARLSDEELAMHRPGYRINTTDTAARDAKEIARAEYICNLENAYKNPAHAATGAREDDLCSINGSPGHLQMVDGKLTCTPDQTQDAMTLDECYSAYAAEISQRWKESRR
jgi:hypothetical protein